MTCIGQNNLRVLPDTYTKVFAPGSTRSSLRSLQVITAQFISTAAAILHRRFFTRQPQLFFGFGCFKLAMHSFLFSIFNYIFQFLLHGSGNGLDDRTGDENRDDRTGSKCAAQGNTTGSQQDVQCHPHIFHRPAIFTCQ